MLTAALASASASAKWNRDSTEYDSFDRFRVGGYGELVAAFKNYGINRFNGTQQGNSHIHRGTISIPRFTIAGDYKWNRRWRLGLEIEFENGGTGTVYEPKTGNTKRKLKKAARWCWSNSTSPTAPARGSTCRWDTWCCPWAHGISTTSP